MMEIKKTSNSQPLKPLTSAENVPKNIPGHILISQPNNTDAVIDITIPQSGVPDFGQAPNQIVHLVQSNTSPSLISQGVHSTFKPYLIDGHSKLTIPLDKTNVITGLLKNKGIQFSIETEGEKCNILIKDPGRKQGYSNEMEVAITIGKSLTDTNWNLIDIHKIAQNQLLNDAKEFLNLPRENPVRSKGLDSQSIKDACSSGDVGKLISLVLRDSTGIVFSDTYHSHISPKKYLIHHMQTLKENGVKYLVMEHLKAEDMADIDTYNQAENESEIPGEPGSMLTDLDRNYMNVGDKSSLKETPKTKEEKKKALAHNYNFTEVVKAAKNAGLPIIPLDTHASYDFIGLEKIPDAEYDVMRGSMVTFSAKKLHDLLTQNSNDKVAYFVGGAHACSCRGTPGVNEINDVFGISFIDESDARGKLEPGQLTISTNVKIEQKGIPFIFDIGVYVSLENIEIRDEDDDELLPGEMNKIPSDDDELLPGEMNKIPSDDDELLPGEMNKIPSDDDELLPGEMNEIIADLPPSHSVTTQQLDIAASDNKQENLSNKIDLLAEKQLKDFDASSKKT
jgi:hypothetical protein